MENIDVELLWGCVQSYYCDMYNKNLREKTSILLQIMCKKQVQLIENFITYIKLFKCDYEKYF
jgi:hypothetical protein